jgi:hypothetical protein
MQYLLTFVFFMLCSCAKSEFVSRGKPSEDAPLAAQSGSAGPVDCSQKPLFSCCKAETPKCLACEDEAKIASKNWNDVCIK